MFGIRKQDVTYPDQKNLHKQSGKSTNSTVAFQNQRLAAANDYWGYHHYDHHNHLNRTCSGQRWCLRDERSCDLTKLGGLDVFVHVLYFVLCSCLFPPWLFHLGVPQIFAVTRHWGALPRLHWPGWTSDLQLETSRCHFCGSRMLTPSMDSEQHDSHIRT